MLFVLLFAPLAVQGGESQDGGNAARDTLEPVTAASLRCEYLDDPLGIGERKPRLSWIVQGEGRGRFQSAYQILVASSRERLQNNEADLWDSGKVKSSDTTAVVYEGSELQSHQACFWKVRLWDETGRASDWSSVAMWSMGLIESAEWQADWIGFDSIGNPPADLTLDDSHWIWAPDAMALTKDKEGVDVCYLHRTIELPTDGEIKDAWLLTSTDDDSTVWVNGQRAGASRLQEHSWFTPIIARLPQMRTGANILTVRARNHKSIGALVGLCMVEYTDGRVFKWTTDGEWTASSDDNIEEAQAVKVIGKFGCDPWGKPGYERSFLAPSRYLRRSFELDAKPVRAMLYMTALGIYEPHVNGEIVTDAKFLPGWTDYHKRVYASAFDVTDHMQAGENVVGAVLAEGWYSGCQGMGAQLRFYGEQPRLRAELHLEFGDGRREVIKTDPQWQGSQGPQLEADLMMGALYDARCEMPGWDGPGFDASNWQGVNRVDGIDILVEPMMHQPVTVFREIAPDEVTRFDEGSYIIDFGTNFAGVPRVTIRNPEPGQVLVMRHGERLWEDGELFTSNLRCARVIDWYVCRGDEVEIWEPNFTFHGFQFTEIAGYPGELSPDDIVGVEFTSELPMTGSFECSEPLVNQLFANLNQTQRANFIDIPTDCPQRDERMGWTGDAQIYIKTATYNRDVQSFFDKWLTDLRDANAENGAVAWVAPKGACNESGPSAWGDAQVICPWTLYETYRDERVLAENYEAMTKWLAFCHERTTGLLCKDDRQQFGDWLNLDDETPKDLLATAYFAYSTDLTARTAAVLGKTEDATKYARMFEEIRAAFRAEYWDAEKGQLSGDTQCSYAMAIFFDLLTGQDRIAAAQRLVDRIEARDWHLSTGFVGTRYLLHALTETGHTDVAYRLLHTESYPSWLFSIHCGATSIWEHWDSWTPEKGFASNHMNSFAHYSFGAVGGWMFQTIGGIDQLAPGFEEILIAPQPGGKLKWAKTSYDSIRGRIACDWERTEKGLRYQITIPPNTTAKVRLAAPDEQSVSEGGKPLGDLEWIGNSIYMNGVLEMRLGSGTYNFAVSE